MLKPSLRLGLSVLVFAHLLAVVTPPLAFQTRGPLGRSPSVNVILRLVERYSQFLYMDRGYAFFAPDPGPSHLIQAAITSTDGSTTEQVFPNRQDQWPRLLYHRHFMITEYLEEIYQPPGPPPELLEVDRAEAEYWAAARARYEHVRKSIVDHLEHVNPGCQVVIRRIEHLIPDVIEFQREPIELSDERLYQVLLDQPIDLSAPQELAAPSGPPESIPAPSGDAAASENGSAEPADESGEGS